MADPTPRTAATARERVTVDYAMVERAIRTALPADMVFAYMPHGDPFAAWAGHLFANLIALAAAEAPGRGECEVFTAADGLPALRKRAEAPGRVAALEDLAMQEALLDARTERDRLTAENERLRADLAVFTEEPGVLARVGAEYTTYWYNQTTLADRNVAALEAALTRLLRFTHAAMSSKPGTAIDFDDLRFAEALAAPAPTPSEPVGRCVRLIASGITCDWPAESIIHSHNMTCDDRPGGYDHAPWDSCHPFTPATRDE